LTAVAEDYLLPTSPMYFGSQFDWNRARPEIITLDHLQRAVLTDQPQTFAGGKPSFSTFEEEVAMAKQFTHAMHSWLLKHCHRTETMRMTHSLHGRRFLPYAICHQL
jgi:hypothetical protein